MPKLNLSSPWVIFYRKVDALFKKDPDVRVIYDEENRNLNLYVKSPVKAAVLTANLPVSKKFGRVELHINVIPANGVEVIDDTDFGSLFDGNDALSFARVVPDIVGTPIQYVVFKKEVVQFYTDDLCDYYGIRSTLYEDIAREVFENLNGIFFCTDTQEATFHVVKPLGEWP